MEPVSAAYCQNRLDWWREQLAIAERRPPSDPLIRADVIATCQQSIAKWSEALATAQRGEA